VPRPLSKVENSVYLMPASALSFKLEEAKTEKIQHLFASSLKRWPKARKSPNA